MSSDEESKQSLQNLINLAEGKWAEEGPMSPEMSRLIEHAKSAVQDDPSE